MSLQQSVLQSYKPTCDFWYRFSSFIFHKTAAVTLSYQTHALSKSYYLLVSSNSRVSIQRHIHIYVIGTW